jgi:hypothetical protein
MFARPQLKAADQFWLCAHDQKGRPLLADRALQLVSGSAVLGDLIVDDYVEVVGDRIGLRDKGWHQLRAPRVQRQPTVVRWLLEQIAGAPRTVLDDWITDIAPDAPLWIVRRLEAQNLVRSVQPGRLVFWRQTRYEPVDVNEPNHLGDHLAVALQRRSALTVMDVFLAGLLQATELHRDAIAGVPHLDTLINAELRALTESVDAEFAVRDRSLGVLVIRTQHLITTAVLAQTL